MKGYAKMAMLMGEFPEVGIFRRFGALNAQNLLYLQAELKDLEITLRQVAEEDELSRDPDKVQYSVNWFALKESIEGEADSNDGKQWRTILEIRDKLKEYNYALLQQSALAKLGHPKYRDLTFLQRWMQRIDMGNVNLRGRDHDIWSSPDLADLVSLKEQEDEDLFTRWVSGCVIKWYHWIIGRFLRKPDSQAVHLKNTVFYSDHGILRATKLIATVLASLLPVAAIVLLYVVHDTSKRLGVIGGCTAVFALCMGLVTSAGMGDIFAATAAFAAVQVVFIGTSGPTS